MFFVLRGGRFAEGATQRLIIAQIEYQVLNLQNTLKPYLFLCFGFLQIDCQHAENQVIRSHPNQKTVQKRVSEDLVAIGKRYLGRPYRADMLNQNWHNEQLVIDTMRLDCWTFTEYCLAQAMVGDGAEISAQVAQLRYRNGEIDGYGSRIHYFSEWAAQAVKNGYLTDITADLGGKLVKKPIHFITSHLDKYPLCAFGKVRETVAASEIAITALERYAIPKTQVNAIESQIHSGDIIGITTGIAGLDFVHQGIAVRRDGKLYLMHASSEFKKVMISHETLAAYLAKNKQQTGIVVLRPV
jgi:hypothetical protein